LIFRFAMSLSCVVIVNLLFYFMLPCCCKAGFAGPGAVFLYLLSPDFPEHRNLLSPGGDKPRHYFSWRASHPAESSLPGGYLAKAGFSSSQSFEQTQD